jgi:hydroxylaminobenzene mutase
MRGAAANQFLARFLPDSNRRRAMDAKRGLVRHGVTLFLAGLVTGFALPAMANPRAGLSGHLEGVMNGTFLIALGCAWNDLRLGERAEKVVYALVLYGTWANWVGTLLSGIFGTSKATPIAGAGHTGTAFQENLVFAILVSVGITMVAAALIAAWSAWRGERAPAPSAGPQP